MQESTSTDENLVVENENATLHCGNDVTEATADNNCSQSGMGLETTGQFSLPKLKSRILYQLKGEDQWKEATVHSHAGKVKGKYKYCLNLEHKDGKVHWYDFTKDMDNWEPISE